MTLALWLLIYLLLTYALGKLYEVGLGWKTVGLIFYPAMLVAAGGRLLACAIAQQKSSKVDLMRANGPSAEPPGGGAFFRVAFSIGPFVACIVAFWLVWTYALGTPFDAPNLRQLGVEVETVGKAATTIGEQLNEVIAEFKGMKLGDWRLWAALYLGFALTIAPAPGRHDLVSVGGFCVALGLVTFLLAQAGVEIVAKGVYGGAFWESFSLLVGMGALVLVLSGVILLPIKFLRSNKED